jgi:hypothetical protein
MSVTHETVVASLLNRFQENGYNLKGVNDGECFNRVSYYNSTLARKYAVESVVSVDDSTVTLSKNGQRISLMIVLDCDPEEILADYTYPPELSDELDDITDAFSSQWEGKKWSKND